MKGQIAKVYWAFKLPKYRALLIRIFVNRATWRGGKAKGAKGNGKKGAKPSGKKEIYDLIVNIDLTEWKLSDEQVRDRTGEQNLSFLRNPRIFVSVHDR